METDALDLTYPFCAHTDQGYVDWCGTMAAAALSNAKVDVPITMCNGATANNTINTCNGNDCSRYLENHGQNGRILIDQPGQSLVVYA